MNSKITGSRYLQRNSEEEKSQLPFNSRLSVKRNHTLSDIFDKVERIVENLKPVDGERGVDVGGGARPNASTGSRGGDKAYLAATVANGDGEGVVR